MNRNNYNLDHKQPLKRCTVDRSCASMMQVTEDDNKLQPLRLLTKTWKMIQSELLFPHLLEIRKQKLADVKTSLSFVRHYCYSYDCSMQCTLQHVEDYHLSSLYFKVPMAILYQMLEFANNTNGAAANKTTITTAARFSVTEWKYILVNKMPRRL
jgi:hypothetical protein